MKTDEQLEKISEEFEKYNERCDNESGSFLSHQLVGIRKMAFTKGFKAAALPLMKKIEELESQLGISKKEKALAINSLKEINRHLSNEEHVDSDWIKDVIEIQSSSYVETLKLQKENEELREALYWSCKELGRCVCLGRDRSIEQYEKVKEIRTKFNLDKEGEK